MKNMRGDCNQNGSSPTDGHDRQRVKRSAVEEVSKDPFDALPIEMVTSILAAVAATAGKPGDIISATMVSKRFRELGLSDVVLKEASQHCLAVRAKKWSEHAYLFLQRCASAGNLEASYILGMILFYCLKYREDGVAKLVAAAMGGHQEAIYSIAIIIFNGSGGTRESRNVPVAVSLCERAALMGHVLSTRELGFCLQDGYGVHRSMTEGRRLLMLAKAKEMAEAVDSTGSLLGPVEPGKGGKPHVANIFMLEWFDGRLPGAGTGPSVSLANAGQVVQLRMCANALCGRQETREREFRRCSVCNAVFYCSRACQARHWSRSHRSGCVPV